AVRLSLERGELEKAGKLCEEAQALAKRKPLGAALAMSSIMLAWLSLEEGRAAEAEAAARQAAAQWHPWDCEYSKSEALDVLARALLDQGKLAEARQAAATAAADARSRGGFDLRLVTAVTAARVQAASATDGQPRDLAEARGSLEAALAQA